MKELKPYYYDKFQCIGSKCPNTCCRGWKILIDKDTKKAYDEVEGDLGNMLKQNIEVEGKTVAFKLDEKQNCPFLNSEQLCDIYINLGEKFMCDTCKTYPRISKMHSDVLERTLTLSCPEVSRLLISSDEIIDFQLDEVCFDLFKPSQVDDSLFNCLLHVRSLFIDIMQKREYDMFSRQLLLIIVADKVKSSIEKKDYKSAEVIINRFYDSGYVDLYIEQFKNLKDNKKVKFDFISELINRIITSFLSKENYITQLYQKYIVDANMSIELILEKYERSFDEYYKNSQYVYENFYVHTIFRYCLDTLVNADVVKHIVLTNIGYIIIHVFDIIAWVDNGYNLSVQNQSLIMGAFSFAFEHNDVNFNNLYKLLEANNLTSLAFQALLLN